MLIVSERSALPRCGRSQYQRLSYGAVARVNVDQTGAFDVGALGFERPPVEDASTGGTDDERLAASVAWEILSAGAPLSAQTVPAAAQPGGAPPVGSKGTTPLGKADILELARWLRTVAPRGPGDLKPLNALLQALLQDMLAGDLSYYCRELAATRAELKAAHVGFDSWLKAAIEAERAKVEGDAKKAAVRAKLKAALGQSIAAIATYDDAEDEKQIKRQQAELDVATKRIEELEMALDQAKADFQRCETDLSVAKAALRAERDERAVLKEALSAAQARALEAEAIATRDAARAIEDAKAQAETLKAAQLQKVQSTKRRMAAVLDVPFARFAFDPSIRSPDPNSITGRLAAAAEKSTTEAAQMILRMLRSEAATALSSLPAAVEGPITECLALQDPEDLGEMAAHMLPETAARALEAVAPDHRGVMFEALARTSQPMAGAVCYLLRKSGNVEVDAMVKAADKVEHEREEALSLSADFADAAEVAALREQLNSSHVDASAGTEGAARALFESLDDADDDPASASAALESADPRVAAAILSAQPALLAAGALQHHADTSARGYERAATILGLMADAAHLYRKTAANVGGQQTGTAHDVDEHMIVTLAREAAAKMREAHDEDELCSYVREYAETLPNRTAVRVRADMGSMVEEDEELEPVGGCDVLHGLADGKERLAARIVFGQQKCYKHGEARHVGKILLLPMSDERVSWGVFSWDLRSAPHATSAHVQQAMEVMNEAMSVARKVWRKRWAWITGVLESDETVEAIVASGKLMPLDEASFALQGIAVHVTRVLKTMMRDLEEIRSYRDPPEDVLRVVAASLLVVGKPGIKRALDSKTLIPVDPAERDELWHLCRLGMELNLRSKTSLLNDMKAALHRDIRELLLPKRAKRLTMCTKILETVSHSEALEASKPLGLLRKWAFAVTLQYAIAKTWEAEEAKTATAEEGGTP